MELILQATALPVIALIKLCSPNQYQISVQHTNIIAITELLPLIITLDIPRAYPRMGLDIPRARKGEQ